MGEMSHTPRLSNFKGQPGREHWARSMSLLLSGGGLAHGPGGRLPPTHSGDEPQERPVTPNDFLATMYRYLGVPLDVQFTDHSGRPMPMLAARQAHSGAVRLKGRPDAEVGTQAVGQVASLAASLPNY